MAIIMTLLVLIFSLRASSQQVASTKVELSDTDPDFFLLGCYDASANEGNVIPQNSTNERECMRACANAKQPLTLMFNGSECTCGNWDIWTKINNSLCSQTITNSKKIYKVYNFTTFVETLMSVKFLLALPSNETLFSFNFGDGSKNTTWVGTPVAEHVFEETGTFKVCVQSKTNESIASHCREIVAIETIVSAVTCSPAQAVKKPVKCNIDINQGSDIKASLHMTSLYESMWNQSISFPVSDAKKVVVGKISASCYPSPTNSSMRMTTYVMPLRFSVPTHLQAWQIVATKNCRAKLQIFRPTYDFCRSNCTRSKQCFPLSRDSAKGSPCDSVCLHSTHCHRNTSMACSKGWQTYNRVFARYVAVSIGSNIISVKNGLVQPFVIKHGDVVALSTDKSDCLEVNISTEASDKVLVFPGGDLTALDLNANHTETSASFSIRLIGEELRKMFLTFRHIIVDQLLLKMELMNQITANSALPIPIAIQAPATTLSYFNFNEFEPYQESKILMVSVSNGTNLTCVWTLPNKEVVITPYNDSASDGILTSLNVTFDIKGSFLVKVRVFNLVSQRLLKHEVTVRTRVTGVQAFLCHATFAYLQAVTCYNTSFVKGEHMNYYWNFANPRNIVSTKETIAEHTYNKTGNSTVMLYAGNRATFEMVNISTKVIPNPLKIFVAPFIEANKPQVVRCQAVWPGGSPSAFFNQSDAHGKGTNVENDPGVTIDLGTGRTVRLESGRNYTMQSYARKLQPGYTIRCNATNHPELNYAIVTKAIAAVKDVTLQSNCEREVTLDSSCSFEGQYKEGDLVSCNWLINDSKNATRYSDCSVRHEFNYNGTVYIMVNISNPVSWMSENITINVTKDSQTVAQSSTTLPAPTPTFTSSTIFSTTASINFSSSLRQTSLPTLVFSSTGSALLSSNSNSATPTTSVLPSSTVNLPHMKNFTLRCPFVAHVGENVTLDILPRPADSTSIKWVIEGSMNITSTVPLIHVFKTAGMKLVEVNITQFGRTSNLDCLVAAQFRILGKITKAELLQERTVRVRFELTYGTNVSYTIVFGDEKGFTSGFLPQAADVMTSYQYPSRGQYVISLNLTSLVGPNVTLSKPLTVEDGPCAIHEVTLLGTTTGITHAPIVPPQLEYLVSSKINASCSSANKVDYRWSFFHVEGNSTMKSMELPKDLQGSKELTLPRYFMTSGLYKIDLEVVASPLGISASGSGFLKVRVPGLEAKIDCGSFRKMSRRKEVLINAGESYDPGSPSSRTASFDFEWSCKYDNVTDCSITNVTMKKAILVIPKDSLKAGNYTFVVKVSQGSRAATAQQKIEIVEEELPYFCLRCVNNCDSKTRHAAPLIFASSICNVANVTCVWSLRHGSPVHHVTRRAVQENLVSGEFVVDKNSLNPDTDYNIVLVVTGNETTTFAMYGIKTDNLPSGGTCDVLPSVGKVIETSFQITCTRWADEDSPLWYEFFFDHAQSGPMLLSYGWQEQSSLLYLPPGDPANDFKLDLHVEITDVLGSKRIVGLTVKVLGFTAEDGPVSTLLKGFVQGPSSKLGKILARGDAQQGVQLMTTVGTVLNADAASSSGTGTGKEDRLQVRDTLTRELAGACCSSFVGLRQVLGGLGSSTRVTTELSANSQLYGSKGFETMATTLATKYKERPIKDEAQGIMEGLSDVLESAGNMVSGLNEKMRSGEVIDWLDDSNAARNTEALQKSEAASQTCVKGVEQTARALTTRKKPGDEQSRLTSGGLEIVVERRAAGKGLALESQGAQFTVPEEVTIGKLSSLEYVDLQVISMEKSPFLSAENSKINSHVSSLAFRDPSDQPIAIKNLSEPISIYLNNGQIDKLSSLNGELTLNSPNMVVYKVNFSSPKSALYMVANFSGLENSSACAVMWRYSMHPTLDAFNLRWNTTQQNSSFSVLLDSEVIYESGVYYIGLSCFERNATRDVRNASRDKNVVANRAHVMEMASHVVYNISLQVVGCMYWDEVQENWSTRGCRVGPNTSSSRTHCLCNHLTWFGSKIFVPPSAIDLSLIRANIQDPAQYAAVVSVMCIIWGLYAIGVVWARRQDKNDALKVGVHFSPSNRPGSRYLYEIVVCVGTRRRAGTTANVAIKLYGDQQDSQPFLLDDSNRNSTPLSRGSNNSFIVTTSEALGQLSYIRIWHDNTGSNPALFVKKVIVRDHVTGDTWHFLCNRWFAVDEGDGMIDRVVPMTSQEELKHFKTIFMDKTKKDLTDSHLWFSIVWRPPDSNFTRVERVSCCLSFLLCTMMANAMWYEVPTGSNTQVDIGPVQFSWEQVSIGIMSSMVVFPINLVIVQIFRNCKAKKNRGKRLLGSPKGGNRVCVTSNSKILHHEDIDTHISLPSDTSRTSFWSNKRSKNPKKIKSLPWWMTYIGWLLVTLTVLASTVVTLMYGIQFGKHTSEKWLLSMFISVTQDIFISQPLKVILLALFFAYVLKKPPSDQNNNANELDSKELLQQCNKRDTNEVIDVEAPSVPLGALSNDALEKARERNDKERKMSVILTDIGTYLTFLWVLLVIAHSRVDSAAYWQSRSISDVLMKTTYESPPESGLTKTFQKISNDSEIWLWTNHVLLPALYNLDWYYYTKTAPKLVRGGAGLVVGFARWRQLRKKKDTCLITDVMRGVIHHCTDPYSVSTQDETNYNSRWRPFNTSDVPPSPATIWSFNSASKLNGYPYFGEIRTYSGGGYIVPFSSIYYKAVKEIKHARNNFWIDRYTAGLFTEFTLYNPYSNLFTASTVLVEVLPTGGFHVRPEFFTFRLYSLVGDFHIFTLVCDVVFLLFTSYFTYRELKKLYKDKCSYFRDYWNWAEIVIMVLAWIAVADYFICLGIRKWTLKLHQENPNDYTNFQYISAWQMSFESILGILVFISTIKFIKLLRFNKKMFLLAYTLSRSAKDLAHYGIMFLIVFLSFAQFYYLLLGSDYDSFSTFVKSIEKLINVLLGRFSFEEFLNPFRIMGAFGFFLYMTLTNFLLLNMFIAIIVESFTEVKLSPELARNEFEIMEFTVERVREVLGIRRLYKVLDNARESSPTVIESNDARENNLQGPVNVKQRHALDKLSRCLDNLGYCINTIRESEESESALLRKVSEKLCQQVKEN
ncbi:uncharacterized protein LOC5516858 isoform X2 [Nematostella vectensis]|uniref:uncharacterized protein LOC5516858 isoform X2 n=1 Tax=Nematostella vectensis TaxID=45351 RepID=UPI002077097C|nr:uncharacterized protein LOC5516858 isoform X2 [Nematostella vectensis]